MTLTTNTAPTPPMTEATTEDASDGLAAQKARRFLLVTAIAAPVNLALYLTLLYSTDWPAIIANLAAATIVTPATFMSYRRWVWSLTGRPSFRREALPYWASTIANVSAASAAIAVIDGLGAGRAVLSITPVAVYAALTAVRYLLLDAWIFAPRDASTDPHPVPDTN